VITTFGSGATLHHKGREIGALSHRRKYGFGLAASGIRRYVVLIRVDANCDVDDTAIVHKVVSTRPAGFPENCSRIWEG
jgi:hypothetical protein